MKPVSVRGATVRSKRFHQLCMTSASLLRKITYVDYLIVQTPQTSSVFEIMSKTLLAPFSAATGAPEFAVGCQKSWSKSEPIAPTKSNAEGTLARSSGNKTKVKKIFSPPMLFVLTDEGLYPVTAVSVGHRPPKDQSWRR